MSWRFHTQAIEAGVVTDVRDFMLNVDAYAREMAGFLDRDNFQAGAVTSAKIGVQELVAVGSNPYGQWGTAVVQTITGGAGQRTEVALAQTSVTVDDGEIIVDADVTIVGNPAVPAFPYPDGFGEKWRAILVIDGSDAAFTDWTSIMRTLTNVSLTASAPVVTGTCIIQLYIQYYIDATYNLSWIANGTNPSQTFASNPMTTTGTLGVWTGNVVWVNRKR